MTNQSQTAPTPAPTAVARSVNAEIVILDLATERYLALDEVGARIWTLLDGRRSRRNIVEAIAAEYRADPEQIAGDLDAFLAQLLELGLVQETAVG